MFALSLCILRPEAANQRKRPESLKKLFERLCDRHPNLSAQQFALRFLQPLRVLKYPNGERPRNGLYQNSIVLINGLELLFPKHEPVLFQSLIKSLIAQDANNHRFEYNGEEIILTVRSQPAEETAASVQRELQMLTEVSRLLETEPNKRIRLEKFRSFCDRLLASPETAAQWLPRLEEIKAEVHTLLSDCQDIGAISSSKRINLKNIRLENL